MAVPISQMWAVASYVLKKRLAGEKRYPLVLMLEPLFRCNLACAGCGKVQYPPHILKKQLTPQECFAAVEECGAPMVSIPGGEPLLHPRIVEIVNGLIARKKYIYLCTNALQLKRRLPELTPSKYLTISVHLDGRREDHDFSVCRDGVYDVAIDGIKEAVNRGFRVTTNATFFDGTDPGSVRAFFDEVMATGVEGMVLSPGYSYDKAPDQNRFLGRARVRRLFRAILSNRKKTWKFNMSPLFLEFLMGDRDYECTPWGSPAYSIFGWQRPCYLLQDGYAETFTELMETTEWNEYGVASGNPKCANCMVSCGYEPTAVMDGLGSLSGLWAMVRGSFSSYRNEEALRLLDEPVPQVPATLVAIEERAPAYEESPASALEEAFDYRGDVTITLRSGERIEAYVFNRHAGATPADSWLQYFAPDSTEKRKLSYAEIAHIGFTGKDCAAGKRWEDWLRTYNERKAAGAENVAVHPEALE